MASPKTLAKKRKVQRQKLRTCQWEIMRTRAFKNHLLKDLTPITPSDNPQRWINEYFSWVPMGRVIKGT